MDVEQRLDDEVTAVRDELIGLSHALHADPELAWHEHRSSARVADVLEAGGMKVERGAYGMETALLATRGSGSLTVTVCAEYDALPGMGHACGHNIIAAAGVGAGLALAAVADELDLTVRVLGTPAEEGGGGKIHLLDQGAFDDTHLAMMVHPAPYEATGMPCLARQRLEITYTGRSAHAAGYPQMGRNAADAFTVAQVGIGLLRQHLTADQRVHGVITHGGDVPNVIPDHTTGSWYVRAKDLDSLAELEPRVVACFEAGALATGTELDVDRRSPPYSQFEADVELAGLYREQAEALGRRFSPPDAAAAFIGSTDMANVSLRVPTIHPMLAIDAGDAVNHQPGFADATITESADRAVVDGALAMARTAAAAARDPALRARLQRRERVTAPPR